MKKALYSSLWLIALIFLLDYIFFKIFPVFFFGNSEFFSSYFSSSIYFRLSYTLLSGTFIFILFQNLLYHRVYNFKSSTIKITLSIALPLILSLHIAERCATLNTFYYYSKNITKRQADGLWRYDDRLGHAGIANAHGFYEYFVGDSVYGKVPVIFSNKGFRTTFDIKMTQNDTSILFLGCSWTFGDFIRSEDSFTHLTAQELGYNSLNAGGSAYGLAQMKLLIDDLQPQGHFKYTFIQVSPWLSTRAMGLKGPAYHGYRAVPYFSDDGKGFSLNYPSFNTTLYESKNWKTSDISYFEKNIFLLTEGFSNEVIDFYAYHWVKAKSFFGLIPEPTKRRKLLECFFYNYAIKQCRSNNSIPVLLKMRYPEKHFEELREHLDSTVQIIDLDHPLNKVSNKVDWYNSPLFSIYHRSNDDSVLIDRHPNPLANQMFTEQIVRTLK